MFREQSMGFKWFTVRGFVAKSNQSIKEKENWKGPCQKKYSGASLKAALLLGHKVTSVAWQCAGSCLGREELRFWWQWSVETGQILRCLGEYNAGGVLPPVTAQPALSEPQHCNRHGLGWFWQSRNPMTSEQPWLPNFACLGGSEKETQSQETDFFWTCHLQSPSRWLLWLLLHRVSKFASEHASCVGHTQRGPHERLAPATPLEYYERQHCLGLWHLLRYNLMVFAFSLSIFLLLFGAYRLTVAYRFQAFALGIWAGMTRCLRDTVALSWEDGTWLGEHVLEKSGCVQPEPTMGDLLKALDSWSKAQKKFGIGG